MTRILDVLGRPQGVDYTGGSGIYLPSGQEISKQQIADYLGSNPTNEDMNAMMVNLGINDQQAQNAMAQYQGKAGGGASPVAPVGANTIGGYAQGSYVTASDQARATGVYAGQGRGWGGDNYQGVYKSFREASPGMPGGGAGGSGNGANLGMGGSWSGQSGGGYSGGSGGQNPYLGAMADDIGRRSNQALGTSLAGIRGNAVGVGGLGGSRQGVAEGVAIGNAQDNLQGNLTNLFDGDWTNQQNRDLQRYGIDTNASTSRYGIDSNAYLTNQGQWQNFYTAQRGQDLQGLQLGANLYGQGNAGYTGQGQGIYNIGNTQQQAPWQVQQNANSSISPYTGYGSTSTTSGSAGGGVNGYIGGALAGAQIGKNLGLGGSSSGFAPTYDSYGLNVAGY